MPLKGHATSGPYRFRPLGSYSVPYQDSSSGPDDDLMWQNLMMFATPIPDKGLTSDEACHITFSTRVCAIP